VGSETTNLLLVGWIQGDRLALIEYTRYNFLIKSDTEIAQNFHLRASWRVSAVAFVSRGGACSAELQVNADVLTTPYGEIENPRFNVDRGQKNTKSLSAVGHSFSEAVGMAHLDEVLDRAGARAGDPNYGRAASAVSVSTGQQPLRLVGLIVPVVACDGVRLIHDLARSGAQG
jgi:hypothetical protein